MKTSNTRFRLLAVYAAALLTVALIIGAGILGWPFVSWAYSVHQAGLAMERGLTWPEERFSDSLPQAVDAAALHEALPHLHRAQRIRSQHHHAFRMEGRVHLASQDWIFAESAFRDAVVRAPGNPLVRFDLVIVYEQMQRVLESRPARQVWPQVRGQPALLTHPAYAEVCSDVRALEGCGYIYVPAVLPVVGWPWEAPFLGISGAGHLDIRLQLADTPQSLAFLVGSWRRDGRTQGQSTAALLIRGEDDAEFTSLASFELPAAQDGQGWKGSSVSLSSWAGRNVTLRLQGETADGFVGWGQLTLAPEEVGALLARTPQARWEQALATGGFESEDFRALATEAENLGREDLHRVWLRRSVFLEGLPPAEEQVSGG